MLGQLRGGQVIRIGPREIGAGRLADRAPRGPPGAAPRAERPVVVLDDVGVCVRVGRQFGVGRHPCVEFDGDPAGPFGIFFRHGDARQRGPAGDVHPGPAGEHVVGHDRLDPVLRQQVLQ